MCNLTKFVEMFNKFPHVPAPVTSLTEASFMEQNSLFMNIYLLLILYCLIIT